MTQARYFVVQHDDVWMIKFDDEEYGPYKSKNEAMIFAIDAAPWSPAIVLRPTGAVNETNEEQTLR